MSVLSARFAAFYTFPCAAAAGQGGEAPDPAGAAAGDRGAGTTLGYPRRATFKPQRYSGLAKSNRQPASQRER
jgi:hypothetical protein